MKSRTLISAAVTAASLAALLCAVFVSQAGAVIASKSFAPHLSVALKQFNLSSADQKRRLTVGCRGRSLPLGGGMTGEPEPTPDGEGIYPHSYERLGQQHGWHVTAVLFDPSHTDTQSHNVILQVICGPRVRHVTPPHTTVFVPAGQTREAIATCPGKRQLFAGGFQRTDFTSRGGDFITESRAISSKSWRVTGHAFGAFGGQLTAIAYCWHSKKPLLTEVSASVDVPTDSYESVFTPTCPPGLRMTTGGFSTNGSTSMFLTDGILHLPGVWHSGGYNSGPPAT